MKLHIAFLVFCLLCFFQASAQGEDRVLYYDLAVDFAEMLPDDQKHLAEKFPPYLNYDVKLLTDGNQARTEITMKSVQGSNQVVFACPEHIYNADARTSITLQHDQQLAVKEYAFDREFIQTGTFKDIMGYQCELMIYENEVGERIEAWVTDQLFPRISPLGDLGLKGLALELKNEAGFHFTFKELKVAPVDGSRFSVPSTYYVEDLMPDFEANEQQSILDNFSSHHMLENKTSIPAFQFWDMDGRLIDSDDLLGKVVVINFWFMACKPCIAEMPMLNSLVAKYADEDVVFIAPSLDPEDRLKSFLAKRDFDYKIIPDSRKYIQGEMGVSGFPTHIILNKNGKMIANISGMNSNIETELEKIIVLAIQDID